MPDVTFLYVTHPEWDFNIRRAATTVALGYCHGFDQAGCDWGLVAEPHLEQMLDSVHDPLVLLGYDNFNRLSDSVLRKLRDIPHIIWVNIWCKGMQEMAERLGHLNPSLPLGTVDKILNSNARFLFTAAPESYFDYWEGWIHAGMRVESLPEACDTSVYFPEPERAEFRGTRVAYVGGYREYKEPVYGQFLWPYQSELTLFGYEPWPKCYSGYLPADNERLLYQNAVVIPAIGEPFAWETGTFYERPFKVLGSGGLTITDTAPAYRELFDENELLVPNTIQEYHDLMHIALTDDEWNRKWRKRGMKAVLERHTYRHRAEKILRLVGMDE